MNSRHIACKLCRERKVRCPGQQPTCDKCRRAGEQCVYVTQQRSARTGTSHLSETVEALQKRLNEAEALILNMSGQLRNNAEAGPALSNCGWPANLQFSTVMPSTYAEPAVLPPGGATLGQRELTHQGPDAQFSGPRLVQNNNIGQRLETGSNEFQASEPMDFDESLMQVYPQFDIIGLDQPSDSQEQTVTQPGSTPSSSNATIAPSHDTGGGTDSARPPDDAAAAAATAILDPLAAYCSSVIRRDAEVAGLAAAVADYIRWLRDVPSAAGAPPPVTAPVYQQMLRNIETRVRELVEISRERQEGQQRQQEQHSEGPLGDLLGALAAAPGLRGGAAGARLKALEEDLRRQAREQRAFFETRYDACRFLKEQMERRP